MKKEAQARVAIMRRIEPINQSFSPESVVFSGT